MRAKGSTLSLVASRLAASVLLLAGASAFAQSAITLTATATTTTLPDGQQVPMWGYQCGATSDGGATPSRVSCTAMNGAIQGSTWQPPLITVPSGQDLNISLTNNLPAGVSTSLVIVGQVGGGLGTARGTADPIQHPPYGVTWPASGDNSDPGATFTPPDQGPRLRSLATELAKGDTQTLTWTKTNLRPGTYLIHSGTHPSIQHPMGLYGVLVVTDSSYPGAPFDKDVPLLFSEIDPMQNQAVATAVATAGFSQDATYSRRLADAVNSVLVTNGGSGYTTATVTIDPPTPCTGNCVQAQATATIDPGTGSITAIQLVSPNFGGAGYLSPPKVTITGNGDGTATATSGLLLAPTTTCIDFKRAPVAACYPPAVAYDPRYYLINGVSFDRTNLAASTFAGPIATATTGNVLLRLVNAGLRMHVPQVVGANMTLYAEDGNILPGVPRVQSSVFMAAGKTYDVAINAGTAAATYPVFDRQLSLSTNNQRDGGMQAYVTIAGGATTGVGSNDSKVQLSGVTNNKTYYCVPGVTLSVTDPGAGLLAGATGANGAALLTVGLAGVPSTAPFTNFTFQSNGTFTYAQDPKATTCGGAFTFAVNGTATIYTAAITQCDAGSGCSALGGLPKAVDDSYSSAISNRLQIAPPGVLGNDIDPSGLPLTAVMASIGNCSAVNLNSDGSFTATGAPNTSCTFTYYAVNSQKSKSLTAANVTLTFPQRTGINLKVVDANTGSEIQDYRWIIEEDRTFWIDPRCQVNSTTLPPNCPASVKGPWSTPPTPVESMGYNFHTAYMPVIVQGCMGSVSCEAGQTLLGKATACDIGNGQCRQDGTSQKTSVDPGDVYLDPNKRYFISVLPGDGVNPVIGGAGGPMPDPRPGQPDRMRPFDIGTDCGKYDPTAAAWVPGGSGALCGHGMGGSQITGDLLASSDKTVTIKLQQTPLPTAKIAVFVFADDNPLNGENDAGGGIDILAPNEAGLGGFEIKLFDQAGGLGDATGQITYDMFNMPVSNALAGTIDPTTGQDACPITKKSDGIVGMIPTCPRFMADGRTPSPLAGQALVANLYPGLYEIVATPGADRIARGEEWLQTNTLDGGKPHEAFIKPNEPGYFQEFGPGGFHVSIGFANPKIINDRLRNSAGTGICDAPPAGGGLDCSASLVAQVTNTHMSRTPDQRLYSSGDYTNYGFTTCYLSLGPADGPDFAFAKCDANGQATFTGIPSGNFKLTVFDQWNDITLDGLVTPVVVNGATGSAANPVVFPVTQWRTNLYTRTYLDTLDGNGVPTRDAQGNDLESGLTLVSTNIRYRDGSYGFFNNTDLNGYAGFNEVFPFMNWLVVETDTTRYKMTAVHTVYDTGGPVDPVDPAHTSCGPTHPCGASTIGAGLANTFERFPLSNSALWPPGSKYCVDADCLTGFVSPGAITAPHSSGRIDPGWAATQAWQGLLGQNSFIEWGVTPFKENENGGIKGHVVYASTRPFDDPQLLLQLSWEPLVPNVTVNLYQVGTAPDGTRSLTLVDTTRTTSFDDWAQGFRRTADGKLMPSPGGGYIPNMNCPGQDPSSPFFATLGASGGSKQYLDPGNLDPLQAGKLALPYSSRFKCYDGWSMLNQVQPAPYDGMYKFPSVVAKASGTVGAPGAMPLPGETTYLQLDPTTYKTNCTICVTGPDGTPMLPAGKYVVEVIVPSGYELVKEEDKNILLGDVYVAPVTQQFAGLGNIFIMPDQATVNSATGNPNNPLNQTRDLGATPRHEGDTGSIEQFWPCVGADRIVPDFNSLFPGAGQNSPFAGAKRALCDRKEVALGDQMTALVKFYIFSSTHVAGHFTGSITNDFASEFDPFSPQFGEKFGPPNLPVAMRDFNGGEVGRVYADQWGLYNGLYFSTWGVNPPNPTGYVPQMAIACMNDPGPILDPRRFKADGTTPNPTYNTLITDPNYSPAYSNFCYETAFMPGFTAYMDTPVIPTQAFAEGYNLPDCEYPDATPAIMSVVNPDGPPGPWVTSGHMKLTITALGDKVVQNPAYSGPNATQFPFNQKTITRHYGFGGSQGSGSVTVGGATATVNSWSDSAITITVPNTVPLCNAGNVSYTGANATARCGELVITAGNGKQSIDAITVTVHDKRPWVVTPAGVTTPDGSTPPASYGPSFGRLAASPLQDAIDFAAPGDLIIVAPDATGNGVFKENVLMWKPVRLQGVGAAAVTINADAHPAGKMDAWRRQVNCLFGLTLDGRPRQGDGSRTGSSTLEAFDSAGVYSCPDGMAQQTDRIPFEGILGWDTTVNGNLAQLLQEPTLMGAYEGAGITSLAKGVAIPSDSTDYFGSANAGGYPANYRYLNNTTDCAGTSPESRATVGRDYATSNYLCNPSRIDGVSIINSSQGGGAVFLHAWNHLLEIANNRISANHGTLTGGITVGTGEFPDPFIIGGDTPPPYPALTASGLAAIGLSTMTDTSGIGTGSNLVNGEQAGYGFQRLVNVHNNSVTANASIGDALFSGTPSGAGGVTFCVGSDYYKFNNNWICGNLSTGDGGGVVHSGVINGGTMAHNFILFNQSINPTLPTNGGGVTVIGASPDRSISAPGGVTTECGAITDTDCPPGLPEGTGRNLLIDANLIAGNSAESGSGGGLRLQSVNGTEVGPVTYLDATGTPVTARLGSSSWYGVTVTNNVIANNVAGWDGGGVSLQDALKVSFVNNTVAANDTTASAGTLFKTIGSAFASAPPPNCNPGSTPDASCYGPDAPNAKQPAGLVTMPHTPNLVAAFTGTPAPPACPTSAANGGFPYSNNNCRTVSLPILKNDLFWQNRAFNLVLGGFGNGIQDQQHLVTLTPALAQQSTGDCPSGANYWDIGVRGDTSRTGGNSAGNARLSPTNSILTFIDNYTSTGSSANKAPADAGLVSQYCNGSRVPPENGGKGYNAPAGRSETTGLSPVFTLTGITPAATVDEGQNWINLTYGPLTLYSATAQSMVAGPAIGMADGMYSIRPGSQATSGGATGTGVPAKDFFGNTRPTTPNSVHIGAVQLVNVASGGNLVVSPATLGFPDVAKSTTSVVRTLTLENTGSSAASNPVISLATTSAAGIGTFTSTNTCGNSLPPSSTCTISVRFVAGATPGEATGTATVTFGNAATAAVNSPVALNATVVSNPVPDLAISKSHNVSGGVTRGSTVVYTVVVQNVGSASVTGAVVTDNRPTQLSSWSWSCAPTTTAGCGTSGNTGTGNINKTLATLAPGASVTFTVTAVVGTSTTTVPPGPFLNTATVTMPSGVVDANLADNTTSDSVTVVVPSASLTGTAFGNQAVNTTSGVQVFTYTNTGNVELKVNTVTLTGANASDYTITANSCIDVGGGVPVAIGGTCTVAITFTPTAAGPRTGTLTVTNSSGAPTQTFNLGGIGSVPLAFTAVAPLQGVTFDGTTLAYGNKNGLQPVETVTLTANAPVTIGTAQVVNQTGTAFSKGSDSCSGQSLAVGQTCTIQINFNAPQGNSARSGQLQVPYTGAAGGPAVLGLTGS
jgi:uncharacterized repeat protein (TIGR01451 family)